MVCNSNSPERDLERAPPSSFCCYYGPWNPASDGRASRRTKQNKAKESSGRFPFLLFPFHFYGDEEGDSYTPDTGETRNETACVWQSGGKCHYNSGPTIVQTPFFLSLPLSSLNSTKQHTPSPALPLLSNKKRKTTSFPSPASRPEPACRNPNSNHLLPPSLGMPKEKGKKRNIAKHKSSKWEPPMLRDGHRSLKSSRSLRTWRVSRGI